jgi:hypothetical protein
LGGRKAEVDTKKTEEHIFAAVVVMKIAKMMVIMITMIIMG